MSGAALSYLHVLFGYNQIPMALLRERLGLQAAAACVAIAGRMEGTRELRDAVHLVRPGDRPGPAGARYLNWRDAVARPISLAVLRRALPETDPERLADWFGAGQGTAVDRAASVLETVLTQVPRAETAALILADAALARASRWTHIVPLLALGLKQRDLKKTGAELRLSCHRAVTESAPTAARLAAELTRRAALLQAVRPKLRAKGAGAAVDLFLTRDAVAPGALASLRSDRAARRLCDRLVDLQAIRELTGRDTFRLYGL